PVKDKNGNIIRYVNVFGDILEVVNNNGNTNPVSKFKDVYAGYWALDLINRLSDLKYIAGYPAGTFRPDGNITMAEFIVMLGSVLKDKYAGGAVYNHESEPNIIPSWHWSYNGVTQALKYMPAVDINKIFNSTFDPDKKITREEVVAVLASALAGHQSFQSNSDSSISLSDIELSAYQDSIMFSVRNGLVVGYPDGSFKPGGNITRAEIAAVMIKVFEKM
ncbi:MAG: S-layer homology domain-containing protein, partial [Eubacteriales bacterium]